MLVKFVDTRDDDNWKTLATLELENVPRVGDLIRFKEDAMLDLEVDAIVWNLFSRPVTVEVSLYEFRNVAKRRR